MGIFYNETFLGKEEQDYFDVLTERIDLSLVDFSKCSFDENCIFESADISSFLNKVYGIDTVRSINRILAEYSPKITNSIRFISNAKDTKALSAVLDEMFEEITQAIDDTTDFGSDVKVSNKRKAKLLLLHVIVFNTVWTLLLKVLGIFGTIISTCVIAPIVEEAAKRIAIKGGYIKEFTIYFNSFEFLNYVSTYASTYGLARMVILRSVVVGMHLSTTLVQKLSEDPEFQQKYGITTPEEIKEFKGKGYLAGVLMHTVWNSGSILLALAS